MTNENYERQLREVTTAIAAVSSVIPEQRKLHKAGFSFSTQPFEQQLKIWTYIWKQGESFYSRLHAYLFLEQHVTRKELLPMLWHTSKSWQHEVDDWALCDSLAKINTKALEQLPAAVYTTLQDWNLDANLWKRRQSVVSLLYFSRTKKSFLPFQQIAAMVTPLLHDPEYYVQKGVGWTLREMHTVYAAETLPYLHKHVKQISAIAFTIAIEKMNDAEKQELKRLRKNKR
jgi:3-methyladenine DNA glycosylase AlkD